MGMHNPPTTNGTCLILPRATDTSPLAMVTWVLLVASIIQPWASHRSLLTTLQAAPVSKTPEICILLIMMGIHADDVGLSVSLMALSSWMDWTGSLTYSGLRADSPARI